MTMLSILLDSLFGMNIALDSVVYKIAAALPGAIVIVTVFIMMMNRRITIIPTFLHGSIKVVAIKTITTQEKKEYIEKDHELWQNFKKIRNTIPNKKEEFSYISIRGQSEQGQSEFPYYMGVVVNDFSQVPEGMEAIEIPEGYYAFGRQKLKHAKNWIKSAIIVTLNIIRFLKFSKKYDFDFDRSIAGFEYHKKNEENKLTDILFYVSICRK